MLTHLQWWREAANVLAVLGCGFCLWQLSVVYRTTRSRWILWMMASFSLLVLVRLGVMLHLTFFIANSRILTTLTFLFFSVAFWKLRKQVLRWIADINGGGEEDADSG